jgi:hypothetical protein
MGYALVALGMIQHSDIRVKSFIIAACFVNSKYFLALGMWISAAVVVLTAFRIGVSMKFRHPVVAVPFVLLSPLYCCRLYCHSACPLATFWPPLRG